MEDPERLRREYQIAILKHQNHVMESYCIQQTGSGGEEVNVGGCLGETMDWKVTGDWYNQLTLRNEDHASFTNFPCMPQTCMIMDDELLRSGSKDNQDSYVSQGATRTWLEACADTTPSSTWT